jgi:DNA helicase HerA-like ATPase
MATQNRIIGRVLSVDNFRVFIKIEEDLRGAYKSGISDIYEVARINSYLIIPVGSDRIVALITRITMKEEMELDRNTTTISLPTSARYISATMLGTISKHGDNEKFIQGVYNFPTLDNPVWYVTEKDLRHIFDDKQDLSKIEYDKDFYLPIGTSPAFPDYKVKICPDQFFVKHAAILGNTGSGKSCTFTSVIRNLFKYDYNGKKLENAHFVIFDTNGEYKDAFLPFKDAFESLNPNTQEELNLINSYYYGGEEKVKVPYWLMNWEDFKALLRPSDGTQAPVLNRAIGLAKNEQESLEAKSHSVIYIQSIQDIITQIQGPAEEYWKIKNYRNVLSDLESKDILLKSGDRLNEILSKIPNRDGNSYEKVKPSEIDKIVSELSSFIRGMQEENLVFQITSEQNIDLPTWFCYQELCTKYIDAAISQEGTNNNRIAEFVSTLRLRMNSFLNDKRMAVPLMLKDNGTLNRMVLPEFLSFLLGDFNRFFKGGTKHFIEVYNEKCSVHDNNKSHQITIVDVSQLPFEVLETVTALLGRMILEFVSYFLPENRGKYPIVIVLEEAQNYIAENKDSVAKTVFERIAREGRKYGISLIVCSQRPSELSKTVLSQCNSFIIHRLQNPDDQKYIRGLISSANADILDQLPIIPQQHAIITGDCVRTPIQVRIDDVSPTPNSHNPKYIERWLGDLQIPYKETCERWLNKKTEES